MNHNNYYYQINEADIAEFKRTGKIPYATKMSGWPLCLVQLVREGKLTQRQAARKINSGEVEISWSCYRQTQDDLAGSFHSHTDHVWDTRTSKQDGRCRGSFSEKNMSRFRGMI